MFLKIDNQTNKCGKEVQSVQKAKKDNYIILIIMFFKLNKKYIKGKKSKTNHNKKSLVLFKGIHTLIYRFWKK